MWSHDVVSTSIGLAGDLKLGQYLKVGGSNLRHVTADTEIAVKIPPRALFMTQLWGTVIGTSFDTLSVSLRAYSEP